MKLGETGNDIILLEVFWTTLDSVRQDSPVGEGGKFGILLEA